MLKLAIKKSSSLVRNPIFFPCNRRFFSNSIPESPISAESFQSLAPSVQEKLQKLESSQPFFDRLIFFDPDVMAILPGPLQIFDPIVERTKDFILLLHDFTGLPWWAVLGLMCSFVRISIMPLIYLQMKRTSKIVSIAPVLLTTKRLKDHSSLPNKKKWFLFAKACVSTIKQQNLKFFRLVLYNLVNIPIIINIVWSIRRLLVEESVKNTSFLWIPTLVGIDPYYILPFLTVAIYYYNFGRFITKENKHTLISKIKSACQVLVILWLPLLCNWPSAIVLYMFYNAVFTFLQSSLLVSQTFNRIVNPKLALYQFLVSSVEYNKTQSDALIEAIKTGEESYKDKAIMEEELVEQMKESLKLLEKETKNKS